LLLNEYTNDRNSISYTERNKFSDMIFGLKVSQPAPVSRGDRGWLRHGVGWDITAINIFLVFYLWYIIF